MFGVKSIVWDAWMIWLLLFRAPRELCTGCAFTALVFAIDAFFYVVRGAISLHPEMDSHALLAMVLTTSNYIFGILCTFLLSTGFTLMLAQRLTYDLRTAAEINGLTRLLNRSALIRESNRRLCAAWEHSHAALLFDLDNFKAVNDCWGHAGGDAVLKHLKHLADTIRAAGIPGHALSSRYGGEESLLLIPGTSANAATLLAEALRTRVEKAPTPYSGDWIAFTTSVGVCSSAETEVHHPMQAADEALYRAKHGGRNRAVLA